MDLLPSYVQAVQLTDAEIPVQLLECCDSRLRRDVTKRTKTRLSSPAPIASSSAGPAPRSAQDPSKVTSNRLCANPTSQQRTTNSNPTQKATPANSNPTQKATSAKGNNHHGRPTTNGRGLRSVRTRGTRENRPPQDPLPRIWHHLLHLWPPGSHVLAASRTRISSIRADIRNA